MVGPGNASRANTVRVLAAKYFADVLKSPGLVACCIFPVLFLALFKAIVLEGVAHDAALFNLLSMGLIFSSAMVPGTTAVYPMAEAREKHALRTLVLAGVDRSSMLAARGLVSMAFTLLVSAACFLAVGAPADSALPYLLIAAAAGFPMTVLALLLGLASRNQMAANLSSLPIVFIGIAPMLFAYSHETIGVLAFLPTGGSLLLAFMLGSGTLPSPEAALPAIAQLVWVALGIAALIIIAPRIPDDE